MSNTLAEMHLVADMVIINHADMVDMLLCVAHEGCPLSNLSSETSRITPGRSIWVAASRIVCALRWAILMVCVCRSIFRSTSFRRRQQGREIIG